MGLCSCHQADTDSSFRSSCQREENDFQGAANLCTLHDQDRPHPAQGVLWLHLLHHVGQPSSSAQDMTMVGCMSREAGLGKRGFLTVLERPSAGARCVSINAWARTARGAAGVGREGPPGCSPARWSSAGSWERGWEGNGSGRGWEGLELGGAGRSGARHTASSITRGPRHLVQARTGGSCWSKAPLLCTPGTHGVTPPMTLSSCNIFSENLRKHPAFLSLRVFMCLLTHLLLPL